MQTSSPAPLSIAAAGARYGLLLALSWIIIDFLLRQVGLSFLTYSIVTTLVAIAVSITGIVLAHRAFKRANAGLMSYWQGVIITLLLMLCWGLASALFNYVYVHYIDPEFVDNLQAGMVEFMERNRVPEAEIEKGTARFAEMKSDFGKSLLSGLTSGLGFGTVLGLLVSIFTKRNHPEFE